MINLEDLGITKEEMQERIINKVCDDLLSSYQYDSSDNVEYHVDSEFFKSLNKQVKTTVEAHISKLYEEILVPHINKKIDDLKIKETNKWGEPIKKELTFVEYITERFEKYISEPVNISGETKTESSSDYWKATKDTKLSWMLNKKINTELELTLKKLVENSTTYINDNIITLVKSNLEEISKKIKVVV